MSVIAPAASTAAGIGVSDDTAADGALFASLFAALVADASATQGDGSSDAAPTASAEVAPLDSEAPTADAAAPGWLLAPIPAPIIPPMTAEALVAETASADSITGAPAAPWLEAAPTAPAIDVEASTQPPMTSPTPTAAAPDQPPVSAPLASSPQTSAPDATAHSAALVTSEVATPAETSTPQPDQDVGPPAAPAATSTEPKASPARGLATPTPAPSTALAAALTANRPMAAVPPMTAEPPPPAEPAEPAQPVPPASPSAATTTASTTSATAAPAPAPAQNLTPPPAPRLRDAQGRGEDRPSNAAASPDGDSASASASSLTPTAAAPSTSNAMAASFAASTPRADAATALPAPSGDAPASTEGDAAAPPALPPLESQAGAPAANRDLGLSMLSRATVETTAQIAAQILKKLDGRSTRFDMALTPEDLGRVDVSLEIDSDGRLTARLAFDNPAAATDLRGRADELRRQLQEAGFQLSQDSLEFAERNPSSGFGGGAFDRPPDRRAFAGAARLAADADLAVPPPLSGAHGAWTSLSLTPDRVDLKV